MTLGRELWVLDEQIKVVDDMIDFRSLAESSRCYAHLMAVDDMNDFGS